MHSSFILLSLCPPVPSHPLSASPSAFSCPICPSQPLPRPGSPHQQGLLLKTPRSSHYAEAELNFKAFLYQELIQETFFSSTCIILLHACEKIIYAYIQMRARTGSSFKSFSFCQGHPRAVLRAAQTELCTCCSSELLWLKKLVKLLAKPPELANSTSSTTTSRMTHMHRHRHLLFMFSLIRSLIR